MEQRVINGRPAPQVSWPMGVAQLGEEGRTCEVCGAGCNPDRNLCAWCAQLALAAFEEL